jgi:hypothetical protein
MQRSCNDRVHKFRAAKRHNRRVNSTETPGGSGIPAGWYDDPSGQGLRWWDGEAWTEHVHTAESAAAAVGGDDGDGEREAPPPELVKLRESIRGRGAKGVGMVLGGVVLIVVVVALLASGGGESSGGEPGTTGPGAGNTAGAAAAKQAEIKAIDKQLKNKKLPKVEKKTLEAEKKKLEKGGKSAKKSAKSGKSAEQKKAPGEEGN